MATTMLLLTIALTAMDLATDARKLRGSGWRAFALSATGSIFITVLALVALGAI